MEAIQKLDREGATAKIVVLKKKVKLRKIVPSTILREKMGTEDGKGAYPEHGHHQHRHSDTDIIGADRTAYSGPLSGPLNKRGGRKSARFNLPDSAGGSAGGDDDQAYVEITLDVRDDSVAVHSVRAAGGGEIEDPELTLLAKGLEKRSSFRASAVVRNASSRIKQVSQELKRFASFSKKSNQAGRFDRNKSAAAHALKGLKFISKTDGGTGWAAVEKRLDDLTAGGLLPRSLFGECIGMNKDSKEFAGELFDALSRRRNIPGDSITKSQLREFWDQISDQSFDSRLQTFFDMVDKDADEKGRERIRQKHSRSERARGAKGNIVALKKKTKLDEGFAFDALQTLADLSLLNRRCIACFLESRGIIEDALEVAIEPDYRFELAL